MLCEVCQENDVAVTLTEVHGNELRQVRLCEACAAARGLQTTPSAPQAALGTFLQSVQQQAVVVVGDGTRCSFCGASLRDFRQAGRLGCAQCYTTFEGPLRDLLRKVHGNARHMGRPYQGVPEVEPRRELTAERLRERLERAIRNEEFELAASLRDQIRALE